MARAAQAVNIGRRRYYHLIEEDPEYGWAFDQVRVEAPGKLENECVRRAMKGSLESVVYKGVVVGTIPNRLLMFLLEAARPEKYRIPKKRRKKK